MPTTTSKKQVLPRKTVLKQEKCKVKPLKDRQIEDVQADSEKMSHPFFRKVSSFVLDPNNRKTTARIMRHLIMEQVVMQDTIRGVAMTFLWIIQDWFYRPCYDLYQDFLLAIGAVLKVDSKKFGKVVDERTWEFQQLVAPALRAKISEMIDKGGSMVIGRTMKRKRESSLPAIQEEEIPDLKSSRETMDVLE